MIKTYMAQKNKIERCWYVIDAEDKILGRLATRAATILRGKHKPAFTPHIVCGDGVIIINASKIRVTGKKLQDKLYSRYSGYPGGYKERNLDNLLKLRPATVVRLAVRRMLPSGPLSRECLKRLKIYTEAKHPHVGQNPIPLEV